MSSAPATSSATVRTAAPQPAAEPSQPSASRRWRPVALALGLLVLFTLVSVWIQPASTSIPPLGIDNPRPGGMRALAQLLGQQGVTVTQARSTSDAIASLGPGMTVAVVNSAKLSTTQRQALANSGADVVVIGAGNTGLTGLTQIQNSADLNTRRLEAQCQDPDALAAGTIISAYSSLNLENAPQAEGCFPVNDTQFAYATENLPAGGTLRVLADGTILTNAHLAEEGHAALGIRALGHHDSVIWLDAARTSERAASGWHGPALPPWLALLLVHLSLSILVLAVIQGRRLGALMPEKLPVVVRSSETTIARGRLYRLAADRERAATALRRGSRLRLAHTLGLSTRASRDSMLDRLTRRTGMPRAAVDDLLYGPAPTSDQALADLAVNLDHLESKADSYD